MGADTSFYVTVLRTHEETIEVQAVTRLDAEHEALRQPGVVAVKEVTHWMEHESSNAAVVLPKTKET